MPRIAATIPLLVLTTCLVAPTTLRASDTTTTEHWSFQPVRDVSPPKTKDTIWATSPIDRFILARLEARGLTPAPPADKHTLIRRVYLDLIGLPPTPPEVAKFVNDQSPNAYTKVVEQLLASPHYGERWARHWLDLVRYSETAGHVQDMPRPHAWKYRDYLIDAFNDDLPYDRFIREHLAGDLLPDRRPGKRNEFNVAPAATGFLWFHQMHFKPVDPVQQRYDQIEAQIDVIGKAFQGLTLACARCHDHKFDPVSARDYYALAGILNSTKETHVRLGLQAKIPHDEATLKQIDKLQGEIKKTIAGGVRTVTADRKPKTDIDVPYTETNFGPGPIKKLANLRAQLAKVDPGSTLWAPGAADMAGADIPVQVRGNYKTPGKTAPRGYLEVLSKGRPSPDLGQRSGRLYLADRIADKNNPLTARVMVNRLWAHHFGAGMVRTPNSFGILGEKPTNPDLLDYLAKQFVAAGWSIKAMHRAMVLTSTYRMSSRPNAIGLEIDPTNRLLHHMPARRLEAEVIRDTMLALSGSLDRTMFGPSVPVYVSPNATANKPIHIPKAGPLDGGGRRSIYLQVRRNFLPPMLMCFDFAKPGESVGKRDVTIVPTQALAMLNGAFVHQQAERWGANVAQQDGDDKATLRGMVVAALGREPTRGEADTLLNVMRGAKQDGATDAEAWADVAHVIFNLNEFVFVR